MKNALITGASRGLGLALARKLAEDGWGLVIDARSRKALDEARAELSARNSGPSGTQNLVAIPGSVTTEAHRKKLAAAARELGGLDAVVNNASFLGPSPQPNLLDYPLDELEAVYKTNIIAPLGVIQAVKIHLR